MRKVVILLVVFVCVGVGMGQDVTQGTLLASSGKSGRELGFCPLKSTAAKVDITGFIARVTVKQEFENRFGVPIEAVYLFPLSHKGAVDNMTMTVGGRTIRASIMKRGEARQTYETAKSEGKTASLLDQERPNMFTQSVANIMPGETVVVEISYVETLKYEAGEYEFVFPMTIGPRYVPASVKDAARVAPRAAKYRNGGDISIEVDLNAGVPIDAVRSLSHAIEQAKPEAGRARVTLHGGKTIPNKDFVLRYDVAGKRIEDAVLTTRDERGGFFTMILQPPDRVGSEDRTPKEIVFVLDTSGSMDGFPIEKAKEAMKLSLDGLYPEDTFNLITFAGDTDILFDAPVPATRANLERAQAFLDGKESGGGTEMMKAITAALNPSDSAEHLRIVCFMTDAQVGNDDEIIAEVQRYPRARVFAFGIGDSVNRHLLDKIAEVGKGEVEYVGREDDGSKAARRFYERVRSPLLTDLSVDWNGMPVADVYPGKLTDLFSAKPVILHGRYTKSGSGSIKLRGKLAGQPYERDIAFNLPEAQSNNEVLSTLWARTRVDELSKISVTSENSERLEKEITDLGLQFRLMTQFTSFVAVDDSVRNPDETPRLIEVPVADSDEDGAGGGGITAEYQLRTTGRKSKISRKSGNVAFSRSGSAGLATGSGGGSGRGSGNASGSGFASGSGSGSGSGLAAAPPPPQTAGNVFSQGVLNATATVSADAAVSEVVTVTSSPVQVVSSTTSHQLQALPMSSRSFSSLLTLSPGAARRSSKETNSFVIDGAEVTNYRTTRPQAGSTVTPGTVTKLNGRALLIVRPDYPTSVRKATGEVAVDIMIDLSGRVMSAKASSGDVLLHKWAERAALLSRFAPTLISGRAIRVGGTIVYNFKSKGTVDTALRDMKALPLTDEDRRLISGGEKLHHWLAAALERLESRSARPGEHESKFVRNGKAEIRVDLTDRTAATLQKLKAAGLEVIGEKGKTAVFGRIELTRLTYLAALDEVKLVLPHLPPM